MTRLSTNNQTLSHSNATENPSIAAVPWAQKGLTPAKTALSLLCHVGSVNTPWTLAGHTVQEVLSASGVCKSLPLTPPGVDIEAANATARTAIAMAGQQALIPVRHGWSVVQNNLTGNFGSDYGLRADIATYGYLMLQSSEAIYPSWSNDTVAPPMQGETLELGPNDSYLYTFSCKPPLQQLGFWSLTAYNSDGYLIANSRNVYSLGDRSNITYESGEKVYGDFANSASDGPFQILVQPVDVAPPANWTSNWLPGPSGGGNMSVLLRWYLAEESIVDGTYEYPLVTKQQAIR